MNVIYERCCGLDIHKNMIMACIFVMNKKEIRKFGTMTDDILEMIAWIKDNNCQVVSMESTGVYWKSAYNLLESEGIEAMVVNAQHIKGVPGRKTDVKDSEWIADLTRHGLVKNSFIPSKEQRELREITRYRQSLIEERAREINRLQAVLEGANIKLASVITDISGKTGIGILKAIVNGETNNEKLSTLAKGSVVRKIDELKRALKGNIGIHQQIMLSHQLRHIEFLNCEIERLDEEINKRTEPCRESLELLDELPGIGIRSAERIIAETGVVMEQFQNADHFASWAGLVPQSNESAGKKKSTRLRKGNVFLKAAIVECAKAAIRNKNSYFHAKYNKIASRRGGNRATVAVAHSMLLAIYHILKNKQHYVDLGSDYFNTVNAEKIIKRHIKGLQNLGLEVFVNPPPAVTA